MKAIYFKFIVITTICLFGKIQITKAAASASSGDGTMTVSPTSVCASSIGNVFIFTFTLRSGTRPDEHIYFSGAPLDSEAHLAYLTELATALTS